MKNIESWENEMHNLAANQTNIPPAFVWDNIEKAIQPEKKRKWLLLWFLFGALVCAGGILLLNVKNTSSQQPGEIQKGNGQSAQYASDKSSAADQQGVTSDAGTSDKQPVSGNPGQPESNEAPAENKPMPQAPGDKEYASVENRKKGIGADNRLAARAGSHLADQTKNQQEKSAGHKVTKKSPFSEGNINHTNSSGTINNTSSLAASGAAGNANPSNTAGMNSRDNLSAAGTHDYTAVGFLSGLYPQSLVAKSATVSASQYLKGPKPKCPTFGKKKTNSFFVGIEGGLGYPLKSMTADPDQQSFLNQRKNTEKVWYAWGAGLQVGYMIKDQWSIATGINVAQVKEKFNTTIKGYTFIQIILDPNGNPIDSTIVTGTIQEEGEKRFTLIDIPVSVGYEHRSGDWGLAVELGATFNLSLSSSGKVVDADSKVVRLEDQDDVFRTNIGLGVQGAVAIHRYLNDHTSIYIKPAFRTYFNDWTFADYPIKTSYNLATLSIGLRYKF